MRQKSGKIINISSVSESSEMWARQIMLHPKQCDRSDKNNGKRAGQPGNYGKCHCTRFVDTEMTEVLSEEIRENACKQIILGRFGKPEDIANTAVFLASDKADYTQDRSSVWMVE